MTRVTACPCCGAALGRPFYDVTAVPVHSVTVRRSEAEARGIGTGDISLALCGACGFVANTAFDASLQDYAQEYISTQAHSRVFDAFHRRLASELIERHDLRGRRIVEIGCGQGEFLTLLCDMGDNDGVGFDPAFVAGAKLPRRVRVIAADYAPGHPEAAGDFIVCKMTLEHIGPVASFLHGVRAAVGDAVDTTIFFQVPDGEHVLREQAFWDVYYEHCSYFSAASLAAVFRRCGFAPLRVWRDYGDQYLMIEARPTDCAANVQPDRAAVASAVAAFARDVPVRIADWRRDLRARAARGERTLLWGGGSKAVAFLTTLGAGAEIGGAVDINPDKHGTFLAGTAHPVLSPDDQAVRAADRVIVMNPIYVDEVARRLRQCGSQAAVVAVAENLQEVTT